MKPLFTRSDQTLTCESLLEYYASIYEELHGEKPICAYLSGPWFSINGMQRDRRWLVLEIELLRQQLITLRLENRKNRSVRRLLKIILPSLESRAHVSGRADKKSPSE